MNMDQLRSMRPQLYRIPPYGEINVSGETTIALLVSDVPYLVLRIGSDAVRIYEGECVPIINNHVRLCNPFHFEIRCQIGIGYDVRQITRQERSAEHFLKTSSIMAMSKGPVAAMKYGCGVMLKKGEGVLSLSDNLSFDWNSSIVLFPNARADFLSLKPGGTYLDTNVFRMSNGEIDSNVISVVGNYTDADIATWVSAAGYSGQITYPIGNISSQIMRFPVSDSCACFFARLVNVNTAAAVRVTHNGVAVEDFD